MSYSKKTQHSEGSTTASTKSSNSNGQKYRPSFSTIGKLQTPDLHKHYSDIYIQSSVQMDEMEELLDQERVRNKAETWNKLDKIMKRQKLHSYAESFGNENEMAVRDVKKLKQFLSECLDKGKLTRTKDVTYNKEKREIESIPALMYTAATQHFSLRNTDTKFVSSLKSMTPKKMGADAALTEELMEDQVHVVDSSVPTTAPAPGSDSATTVPVSNLNT
jgi:hypothetical protein